VIQDKRLVILRHAENAGMVANFNACLNAATGELFLMLSDDDWLEPAAIENLSHPFIEPVHDLDPRTVGMTWCPCTNVDAAGTPLWAVRGGPSVESPVSLLEYLFNGTRGTQFSGVMIRTIDAFAAGGYDGDRYGILCDTANWGKAMLRYDHVVCIDEPLMNYTIHTSTASGTSSAACRDWQLWINHQVDDFSAIARDRGDLEGERRILRCRKKVLANITATVLMRFKGKPGWVGAFVKEIWRSRDFMLTPFVAKRILKDSWKLLRLE
jgi:glycosyltransferase involved in cell wall biosynthesis